MNSDHSVILSLSLLLVDAGVAEVSMVRYVTSACHPSVSVPVRMMASVSHASFLMRMIPLSGVIVAGEN